MNFSLFNFDGYPVGEEDMNLVKESKYLSLILRHKPEAAGITLDEHGWADVDEVVAGIGRGRMWMH